LLLENLYLISTFKNQGVKMADEKRRSANDQRSDVFNPTSGDSQAAFNNRSNQLNPNSQAYRSSRFKGKK